MYIYYVDRTCAKQSIHLQLNICTVYMKCKLISIILFFTAVNDVESHLLACIVPTFAFGLVLESLMYYVDENDF